MALGAGKILTPAKQIWLRIHLAGLAAWRMVKSSASLAQMNRVLVTGGAGFIGSHLVEALLRSGSSVWVLDNLSSGSFKNIEALQNLAQELALLKNLEFHFIEGSIQDPRSWEEIPNVESVFHLAAQTSVTQSVRDTDLDFASNISFIPHLTKYILRAGVRRLINCNTAGAFYGVAETLPTPEDDPFHPLAPYGATKAMAEIYLGAWTRALRSDLKISGDSQAKNYFSWASLRLANVYGPGQLAHGEAGIVPIFFDKIINHQPITIFGDGGKTRDYVFVADVIEAFLATWKGLNHQALDLPFNVGTGVETRDLDVYREMKSALESMGLNNFKLNPEPEFSKVRPGEVLRSCVDSHRIGSMIGWKARMKFSDGIRRTLDLMVEALQLNEAQLKVDGAQLNDLRFNGERFNDERFKNARFNNGQHPYTESPNP